MILHSHDPILVRTPQAKASTEAVLRLISLFNDLYTTTFGGHQTFLSIGSKTG